jgi:hypothetical protein
LSQVVGTAWSSGYEIGEFADFDDFVPGLVYRRERRKLRGAGKSEKMVHPPPLSYSKCTHFVLIFRKGAESGVENWKVELYSIAEMKSGRADGWIV